MQHVVRIMAFVRTLLTGVTRVIAGVRFPPPLSCHMEDVSNFVVNRNCISPRLYDHCDALIYFVGHHFGNFWELM